MKLPFKKGDRVRFSGKKFLLSSMQNTGIDIHRSYTVISCYPSGAVGGFSVAVHGIYDFRVFSHLWFELDKNSIVNDILKDL